MPAWLAEILPAYFTARPALTEALFAFVKSLLHATWMVAGMMLADAYSDHATGSLADMAHYVGAHWINVLVGYAIGTGIAGSNAIVARNKAAAAQAP